MRQRISSGSPYEAKIGISRAVRIGPLLAVSGTAPIATGGGAAAPGDVYGQTVRCFEIARDAIEAAGFSLEDAIRVRTLLTDISCWEEAARAHGEWFGEIRPASTFVEVSGFIDPAWLVEIEVDCYRPTAS
jgi:enamine deaminase RidA (YjgF/YER057c/UK114 family)